MRKLIFFFCLLLFHNYIYPQTTEPDAIKTESGAEKENDTGKESNHYDKKASVYIHLGYGKGIGLYDQDPDVYKILYLVNREPISTFPYTKRSTFKSNYLDDLTLGIDYRWSQKYSFLFNYSMLGLHFKSIGVDPSAAFYSKMLSGYYELPYISQRYTAFARTLNFGINHYFYSFKDEWELYFGGEIGLGTYSIEPSALNRRDLFDANGVVKLHARTGFQYNFNWKHHLKIEPFLSNFYGERMHLTGMGVNLAYMYTFGNQQTNPTDPKDAEKTVQEKDLNQAERRIERKVGISGYADSHLQLLNLDYNFNSYFSLSGLMFYKLNETEHSLVVPEMENLNYIFMSHDKFRGNQKVILMNFKIFPLEKIPIYFLLGAGRDFSSYYYKTESFGNIYMPSKRYIPDTLNSTRDIEPQYLYNYGFGYQWIFQNGLKLGLEFFRIHSFNTVSHVYYYNDPLRSLVFPKYSRSLSNLIENNFLQTSNEKITYPNLILQIGYAF